MTAQAQTAQVGEAVTTFSWAPYYGTITITNPSAISLFARTDGVTTPLSGSYLGWEQVPPYTTGIFQNNLSLPNANVATAGNATQVQVAASSSNVQVTVLVE